MVSGRRRERGRSRWEWVHPWAIPGRPDYAFAPAGVFCAAGAMERSGFSTRVWDAPLQGLLGQAEETRMRTALAQAQGVAISLHWHEHSHGALDLARWVRSVNPSATVIVGGLTASAYPKELLALAGEAVDAVVVGEAEEVMVEVARLVASSGRETLPSVIPGRPPRRDWPASPGFALLENAREYTRLDMSAYHPTRYTASFWLKAGVGCPYRCVWCGGGRGAMPKPFGERVRLRPAGNLAHDVATLAALGVHEVCLTHDVSINRDYWKEFFRSVQGRRFIPGLYLEAWQCPDQEFLTALATTFDPRFSRVVLSPTSGEDGHRAKLGKTFTNSELRAAIRTMERLGLRHEVYFAHGLPGETETTAQATVALAEELADTFRPVQVNLGGIVLDPFCPMQRHPEAHGLEVSLRSFRDYYERARARALGQAYDLRGYRPSPAGSGQPDLRQVWAAGPGRADLTANAMLSPSPFLGTWEVHP